MNDAEVKVEDFEYTGSTSKTEKVRSNVCVDAGTIPTTARKQMKRQESGIWNAEEVVRSESKGFKPTRKHTKSKSRGLATRGSKVKQKQKIFSSTFKK